MATKYTAYVYPNVAKNKMGSSNPYIENLKRTLSNNDLTVDPSVGKNAFLDFLFKGFRTNVLVLNWIENLPSRRFGVISSLIFIPYIFLMKIRNVKIIWIKHNKVAHDKYFFWLKKWLQNILFFVSDQIIEHSYDSDLKDGRKAVFIHHPTNVEIRDILTPSPGAKPEIDLLIWGTIWPYKGIREFLEFAKNDEGLRKLKIHIIGRSVEEAYWNDILKYKTGNIEMHNQYLQLGVLKELFENSRFILFTYRKETIMSSGALIDSLLACKKIIAPNCGAFRDIARSDEFVIPYEHLSEIAGLCNDHYNDHTLDPEKVKQFYLSNSWDHFGIRIKELIDAKKINSKEGRSRLLNQYE